MQGRDGLAWARIGKASPALVAILIVSACSNEPDNQAVEGNATTNAVAARFAERMAGTPLPASSAKAFVQSEKTDLLEFLYAYPAQAAAVPALVTKFDKAMTAAKTDALKMAQNDAKSAKQAGFPFRTYSLETRWSVKADTPRFLSLESQTYVFTGGAHGMTGYEPLLWDKARNRETNMAMVMTSSDAFAAAIHDQFCAALDKERAEKRGAPVVRGDDDFTKCIDPMKEVLVPTSKDSKLIDAVTVVVAPYSAGPYSEGSYDVVLPVDAAMRAAIKTEYQDGFIAAR
ncbi:DUF4163 domain-containing protein [Sphingobium aromaticiconvertens]|uniref:DUF4163 domain-containing protein n=1 Tax=Sphingobium aromaticiconvertens TaxID=365341 RepID=UPI00301A46B3